MWLRIFLIFTFHISHVVDSESLLLYEAFESQDTLSRQELPQRVSTMFGIWPLFPPHSAARMAIIPVGSFQLGSGYWNFMPLMCEPRIGKNMGTSGSCMSFEVCERSNLRHSVPLPSSGILGEIGFVISYFVVVVLVRKKYGERTISNQLISCFFFEGINLFLLYIYLIIN